MIILDEFRCQEFDETGVATPKELFGRFGLGKQGKGFQGTDNRLQEVPITGLQARPLELLSQGTKILESQTSQPQQTTADGKPIVSPESLDNPLLR